MVRKVYTPASLAKGSLLVDDVKDDCWDPRQLLPFWIDNTDLDRLVVCSDIRYAPILVELRTKQLNQIPWRCDAPPSGKSWVWSYYVPSDSTSSRQKASVLSLALKTRPYLLKLLKVSLSDKTVTWLAARMPEHTSTLFCVPCANNSPSTLLRKHILNRFYLFALSGDHWLMLAGCQHVG